MVETPGYLDDAHHAKMTEADREAVVSEVSETPGGGDDLGGGVQKVRVARPGRGKSKGWRVLVGFVGRELPAYLLAVFGKGDRANLTASELKELQAVMKAIKAAAATKRSEYELRGQGGPRV